MNLRMYTVQMSFSRYDDDIVFILIFDNFGSLFHWQRQVHYEYFCQFLIASSFWFLFQRSKNLLKTPKTQTKIKILVKNMLGHLYVHSKSAIVISIGFLLLIVAAPMTHCSVAQCSLPCRGAAPPSTCPETIPKCASGCACMADCEQQAIVCFETKHCVQMKKYYARTMKHKRV